MGIKKIVGIRIVVWLLLINGLRLWPVAKGENYYRRLSKWYLLMETGRVEEANKIQKKLSEADTAYFRENNQESSLKRKLNDLTIKSNKNADDWMEMATLYYRLGRKEDAYGAIQKAHEIDPIREDIDKLYFTFQRSQLR